MDCDRNFMRGEWSSDSQEAFLLLDYLEIALSRGRRKSKVSCHLRESRIRILRCPPFDCVISKFPRFLQESCQWLGRRELNLEKVFFLKKKTVLFSKLKKILF